MRRFTSRYLNKIDRKGRVSVPSPFRAVIEDQGATHFYLKRNLGDGAIDGVTEAFMAEIQTRIEAMDIGSDERDALEDEYFAESVEVRCDPEGRIILPRDAVDFAGLGEEALFVGLGSRFQIWNPETYKASRERRSETARKLTLKRVNPATGGGSE